MNTCTRLAYKEALRSDLVWTILTLLECRALLAEACWKALITADVIGNYGNSVRDEFVSRRCVIDEALTAGRTSCLNDVLVVQLHGSKRWRTYGTSRFSVEEQRRNQEPLSEIA